MGQSSLSKKDIQREVMNFYKGLMGSKARQPKHVGVEALRKEKRIIAMQRDALVTQVTKKEIEVALHGIGDMKAPGIDGYGAKFYKACRHIIKKDVIDAVQEFFSER